MPRWPVVSVPWRAAEDVRDQLDLHPDAVDDDELLGIAEHGHERVIGRGRSAAEGDSQTG